MKYQITWCEVAKEGEKDGRAWKMTKMNLKDESGVETANVTTFDPVINGTVIEGEIVQNGQFLNFKMAKLESGRKPNMDRIVEKKASLIAEAQTEKAKNIAAAQDRSAWMWAKNNASLLIANHPQYKEKSLYTNEITQMVNELATKIYNCEPTEPFN